MKNIGFLLLICIFFLGCGKDEESYPKELNLSQMFGLIGKSPIEAEKGFDGVYIRDTVYKSSSHREAYYGLITEEKTYNPIIFNFNDGKSMDKFTVSVNESFKTSGSIISFVQKLSDRANSASPEIEPDSYHAEYTNSSSDIRNYNNREAFWNDILSADVKRLNEYWVLKRKDNVYIGFEINLEFNNNLYKLSLFGQIH